MISAHDDDDDDDDDDGDDNDGDDDDDDEPRCPISLMGMIPTPHPTQRSKPST
jgi:hypothetical protein